MSADYEKTSTLLTANRVLTPASQVHGLLCGQLCAGGKPGDAALSWHLLGEDGKPSKLIAALFLALQEEAWRMMQGGNFAFQPLLPADDEELPLRVYALGSWCEGFNTGFGGAYIDGDKTLSPEVQEVLKDFAAVAEVDDVATEDIEKNEEAYMQVVEYVRMAANSVFYQHHETAEDSRDAENDRQDFH